MVLSLAWVSSMILTKLACERSQTGHRQYRAIALPFVLPILRRMSSLSLESMLRGSISEGISTTDDEWDVIAARVGVEFSRSMLQHQCLLGKACSAISPGLNVSGLHTRALQHQLSKHDEGDDTAISHTCSGFKDRHSRTMGILHCCSILNTYMGASDSDSARLGTNKLFLKADLIEQRCKS